MFRILFALLILFLLSGKFAQAQSLGSFLVYENDTINRINERGMKVGKWVYFQNDTFKDVRISESYSFRENKDGLSVCTQNIKKDTIRFTNQIPTAQGNYIQNLKEGEWIFGMTYYFHAVATFAHDTISKLNPILAYDDNKRIFCLITFIKNRWVFCYRDNNDVWNERNDWPDVQSFFSDFFDYDRINYPFKLTVR